MTELRNKLGHYLRLVKRGETVLILKRSVPVAILQGIQNAPFEGESHLRRLVRDGIVTPGKKGVVRRALEHPPIKSSLDPVKVLVEERGDA